ncbi:MAG: cell division/cell wall cluster transcriptional repressor MraZ [Alphaproteobacteria bacterium]|nr:cell division/cell wall cluster transcriptional repressor MraZ [Alphaproteobacteria bacterium]
MSDFIGRYLNKVDKKGRVSVPAGWRPSLISKDFSGIIAQSSLSEKAIDAYPRDYLELLQGKLDLNDPLLEENEYESTVIFGGSVLSFDSEGRVVLSDSLRNEINLASEALFVGMGRRFRIWNPKIFNEYLGRAKSYMDKRRKNKA